MCLWFYNYIFTFLSGHPFNIISPYFLSLNQYISLLQGKKIVIKGFIKFLTPPPGGGFIKWFEEEYKVVKRKRGQGRGREKEREREEKVKG